jgi:hypothetical protein
VFTFPTFTIDCTAVGTSTTFISVAATLETATRAANLVLDFFQPPNAL